MVPHDTTFEHTQTGRPAHSGRASTAPWTETVPVPRRMLISGLAPSALRLYATLYQRGASVAPVGIPLTELSEHTGYSQRQLQRALNRLAPFIVIRRRGAHSTPFFYLRSRAEGAA